MASPLLVILTGPSGAGKDSILARLKALGRPYHFSVNATTRPQRSDERHGVDYYFVSPKEFRRMAEAGELLEHAVVYGQQKGVPIGPIREALAAGKDVIMRTDIQGARHIKSVVPEAVTIFVTVKSPEELERRLRERGEDSPEQIDVRLRTALEEMAAADEFDYTVVNDDLERATDEVQAIVERERSKPGRRPTAV